MALTAVTIGSQTFDRFRRELGDEAVDEAIAAADRLREKLGDRVVWNVNSTAIGGGVAEMLPSLLAYSRGHGIDARWMVIAGDEAFFRTTKRLHHALHGSEGDGRGLTEDDHAIYAKTCRDNAHALAATVQPRDVVILHDPQTAGMVDTLVDAGAIVVWRCHIGHDAPNEFVEAGWSFLLPYLQRSHAFVFSRHVYVPAALDGDRIFIIQPSIDAFSPKNQVLSEDVVRTILVETGLVEGPLPDNPSRTFIRNDGSPGRVERHVDVVRGGRAPAWETPLVLQVSRWDPLKDMLGVMEGFAKLVDGTTPADAALVLAGPNVHGVADDPEGPKVFDEVLAAWFALPHETRNRVHLAMLPTADVDENAAIVNALQRHATIVVQKSLYEGFGLTVTEAMWKARAVIASGVGGIQDQIVDGESGLLLQDPTDLDAFAELVRGLLEDPDRAQSIGEAAQKRVREQFLGIRHLLQYADLIERLEQAAQG